MTVNNNKEEINENYEGFDFDFKIIGDVRRDAIHTPTFKKYKDKIIEMYGKQYLITITWAIANYNNTTYDNYLAVRADDLAIPGEYGFHGDLKHDWVRSNENSKKCAWLAYIIYKKIINECIDFYSKEGEERRC